MSEWDKDYSKVDKIQALVKKLSRRGVCWLGEISDVGLSSRPLETARRAGLNPPPDLLLAEVSLSVASRVISYGCFNSLAHGERRYREGAAREALAALRELGPETAFWANEPYIDFSDQQGSAKICAAGRMTQSTFEVGVIAASPRMGFIWWRTEED